MNTKHPYIHLFKTSEAFYLYDVNTNRIQKISEQLFVELDTTLDSQIVPDYHSEEWKALEEDGFLKENRVERVEHPETPYLPFLLANKMKHMTLQVTQRCNLRCEYCVYSGGYNNRSHNNIDMSWDTAKMAMDMFIEHSRDTNPIMLSFYGGEPLLNLKLIRQCVDYMGCFVKGKTVKYAMTTNGTLLTPDTVDFLVSNKFELTISLDGPEEVHDRYRRFANDDCGSFRVLKENYRYIKENYPEYADKVSFNTVLDPEKSYDEVRQFINNDPDFSSSKFLVNTIDPNYGASPRPACSNYIEEVEYEYFLFLLHKLGKLRKSFQAKNALARYRAMVDKIVKAEETEFIGPVNHHGGPCVPGVSRLFVNVHGNLYPCERVSELSENVMMGHIAKGIDIAKACDILNIGKITEEKCCDCWCYRYCSVCVKALDGITEYDFSQMEKNCQSSRVNMESAMKEFCVLQDLGYDFFVEKNARSKMRRGKWYV